MANSIKVTNNIPKLIANLDQIINRTAGKAGAYFEAKLIDRINEQDSRWPPLSEKYLAWKKRTGKSELTWVQTGQLREVITYRVVAKGSISEVQVGIFNHPKGYIAHVLEYGTDDGTIPERPLFRPIFIENKDEVIGKLKEWLAEEFRRYALDVSIR